MLESHEAALLEEHLRQRIEALREDVRELERRLDARITLNSGRLSALEGWENQVVGASKAGRIVWVAVVSAVVGLFTLWTWVYEHFVRHQ